MNSGIIAALALIWFVVAYFTYGRKIEKTLIEPEDKKATPAVELNDGVDYYPAKPFLLFGHHFSSIAGAGPIIGPIAAVAAFGWGISFIWILFAAVFLGAVHDYLTLMISTRHQGVSIAEIAEGSLGKRARLFFSIFIWLSLILVTAVFGVVAAKTFTSSPKIVFPSFMLIPLAVFFGWIVYRRRLSVIWGTVIALILLGLFIYLGKLFPVSLPWESSINFKIWFTVLMLYGLLASVLPVWILLQPRDYLSAWILILGMSFGLLGLFVSHPNIEAPFYLKFTHPNQGPLWPMLFILIACGAISGFHSLVSGGTTSKQLAKERQGRFIAFGSMLTEGMVAIFALLAVSAGLSWKIGSLGQDTFFSILKSGGPIKAFGLGYGHFVENFCGLTLGVILGATLIQTFVMTTLDTTVRLGRFITTELFSQSFPIFKNRLMASLAVVIPAYFLGVTGGWQTIWPIFGASNQLVAALALLVITSYLLGVKKPTRFTIIPSVFMLVTTLAALLVKGHQFFFGKTPHYFLGSISLILIALAILMTLEIWRVFQKRYIQS